MNIKERGPNNTQVIDRTGVPIQQVCELVCDRLSMEELKAALPVTDEEVYECIETFVREYGPRDSDYMNLACIIDEENPINQTIDTVSISDWVFLAILDYGFGSGLGDFSQYHITVAYGVFLSEILKDCMSDIVHGMDIASNDPLHAIVLGAFEKMWEPVRMHNVDDAIHFLGFNSEEIHARI